MTNLRKRIFAGTRTLVNIEAHVAGCRRDGVKGVCPVCDHTIGPNRRAMRKSLVAALCSIAASGPDGMTDGDMMKLKSASAGKDFPFLRDFGLTELKRNGSWRATKKGVRFLRGEASIPKFLMIEYDAVVGVSEDRVHVDSVMPDAFSLSDVLGAWGLHPQHALETA